MGSYNSPTEQFVLFHRRIFHHRSIQEPPDLQSPKQCRSHQYRAVFQLLSKRHERGVLRSYPAMVL